MLYNIIGLKWIVGDLQGLSRQSTTLGMQKVKQLTTKLKVCMHAGSVRLIKLDKLSLVSLD